MIGLPRKKTKVGPVAFENMLPEQREKLLLSWFVGVDEALEAIMGRKITESKQFQRMSIMRALISLFAFKVSRGFSLKMHGKWFLPY